MSRREYQIDLKINDRSINKVVIDPHYELKHGESINDKTILELVYLLDQQVFQPVKSQDGFEYFVEDKMKLAGKLYKLVWLLHEDEVFIGVINCYRRS